MVELARLHQVAGSCSDLAESRHFYEELLGARFMAEFDPPGLVFFDLAGMRLLLERGASSPALLYFWVDDIDATYEELCARGVHFEGEPHLIHKDDEGLFGPAGEGEWMAFFKDPGGNTLALATRR